MRPAQLVRFALDGLRRQKVRTVLTAVGVAVGTCILTIGLSLGLGLRALVDREFLGRPGFWQVTVFPGGTKPVSDEAVPEAEARVEGTFSPERTARLKQHLINRYRNTHRPTAATPLDDASLATLAGIPDVTEVRTTRSHGGQLTLGDRPAGGGQVVVAKLDVPELSTRLVHGRLPAEAEPAAVVSETLLYDLGVRDEAGMAAAVGTPLRVEFEGSVTGPRMSVGQLLAFFTAALKPTEAAAAGKLLADLPRLIHLSKLTAAEKAALAAAFGATPDAPPLAGTFPVAGVVRAPDGADENDLIYRFRDGWTYAYGDAFLPRPAGAPLVGKQPRFLHGYDSATLLVRPGADLPAVDDAAKGLGFQTASAADWYAGAKAQVLAVTAGLNVFALVALFVAGLGITNTLVTSVVERTREIGILMAVGATRRQIRGLFLAEGGVIGLTGGLVGYAAARLIAGPADRYVQGVVQQQAKVQHATLLSDTVFEFPAWLSVGAILFAVLTTTLAAYYPARRAARLQPVEALRMG